MCFTCQLRPHLFLLAAEQLQHLLAALDEHLGLHCSLVCWAGDRLWGSPRERTILFTSFPEMLAEWVAAGPVAVAGVNSCIIESFFM